MQRSGKRKPTKKYEQSWTNSDGMRLQELFDNGSLSLTDTSAKVLTVDEYFEKFSRHVIAHRLGQLKKQIAKTPFTSRCGSPADIVPSTIKLVTSPSSSDRSDVRGCDLICENMPFLRFKYMDANNEEKFVILLDLPGGSTHYEWEFNEQSDGIILRVNWSQALCDVASVFGSALKTGDVTMDDPKLRSMQDTLSKRDITRHNIPKYCIRVRLGIQVSDDDNSWKSTVITHEGSKILMIEFSQYRECVSKKLKRGSFGNE